MINKIRTLLDLDVKLEEMKLENGTVVEAESFEKGKEIFIKTDDEKVAMPVGEYILEDGKLLVVEEEGIIADVRDVSDEVPAKEEEETEDLEHTPDHKYMTKEEAENLYKKVAELEEAIKEMKKDSPAEEVEANSEIEEQRPLKSRTIKEEFSENEIEVNEAEEVEATKEELSEDVKEELSEPAADPIKHSPEAKSDNSKILFAQKRRKTTMDTVLEKISNF